ncbi:MAG TPA: class I SAM-dependent methyltransferase [Bryobacteraceae bacterium]|nr:class I SAM-dependent methyltransferase [Bryobacteraceae bacterium]
MIPLPARQAYALLAADYDRAPNALISLEQRVMTPLLPELGGRRVIDAGAGTGRWAARCAARGASAVAVDVCREMLQRCPLPAVQAEGALLPFPDSCADLAVCAFALGYAPAMFGELPRVVRPGGMILASDVHPEALRRGWTRAFPLNGAVIGVAHCPYSLDDLRGPRLRLTSLFEPRLGEPERLIFEQAGCPGRFAQAAQFPAIFVAQWIRI